MAEFFGVIGELVKSGRVGVGQDYQGEQAENYDLVQSWTGDVDYYVQMAKTIGGPVLELACGTGRVGMALARSGFELTGIDLSTDMLAVFQRKLKAEPELSDRVHLHQGDVCKLALSRKFKLIIMPCYSFTHLTLPDQRRQMLAGALRHLEPGGTLTMEVPLWVEDEEMTGNKPQYSFWRQRGEDVVLSFNQTRIEAPRLVTLNFLTVILEHGGAARVEAVAAQEYRATRPELIAMVREAGFSAAEVYRDYRHNPLGNSDHSGVLVAQK